MEYVIPVGLLCSLLGVAISYIMFSRSKSKEDKGEGQQTGVVLTELGYIKASMDSVNAKLDKQEERNLKIIERLSSVEASAKQAHKRLDHLEGLPERIHEH